MPALAQDMTKEEFPIGKTSNGYPFEYQSAREGPKRIYRVRSVQGAPLVPVIWKSNDEEFLSVYIPRTQSLMADWIEAFKVRGNPSKGKTQLHYGLAKDAFEDVTTAYIWDRPDDARGTTDTGLVGGIKGTLTTADGEKTFTLDLTLASQIKKGVEIHYTLFARGPTQTRLKLVDSKQRAEENGEDICIVWESADSAKWRHAWQEAKLTMGPLSEHPLQLVVQSDGKPIEQDGVAVLYFRGKEFAKFSVPAYRSVVR